MAADGFSKDPTDPSLTSADGLPQGPSKRQQLIENITSLFLALLLVFMIRSSVVEAFKIPSGSMIPTLFVGDHIFVNKFAYGFKIPFSDLVTDEPIHIIKRDPPKRGDIIVFMYPKDESIYYIKRVIGTPGDTLEIKNKQLFLNGKKVEREPLPTPESEKIFDALDDPKFSRSNIEVYREDLGTKKHLMMLDKSSFLDENRPPVTIPEDNLFVMGDNRDFSNDSRFWGFVPYRNVKGRAMVIWLSLVLNFSNPVFNPARIGTVLQ